MRKTLFRVLLASLLCLLLAFTAMAAEPETAQAELLEDGDWQYQLVNGSYVVSKYLGSDAAVTIPTSAVIDGNSCRLRAVGDYAFDGNQTLESVIIPADILQLGRGVFRNCGRLSYVEIQGDLGDCSERSIASEGSYYSYDRSSGAAVFYNAGANASGLTVAFADGVKSIPAYLFASLPDRANGSYAHLTKLVIGNDVTEIGAYAFYHCYDLAEIEFGAAVSAIGERAFQGNDALTELRPNRNLLRIGEAAFSDCGALKTVQLNARLQTIGKYAFERANALVSLTLPRSVTEVQDYAFQSCQSLTSVLIEGEEGDVTALRRGVFRNCPVLSSVEVRGDLADCSERSVGSESSYYDYDRSSGASVFYNAGANAETFTVTFGEYATRVPDYLFASVAERAAGTYAHVTKVVLGDEVTEIGQYAFYHCYDLAEVTFGSGVSEVRAHAFQGNAALTELRTDRNLLRIGEAAFSDCGALKTVQLNARLQTIGKYAFERANALVSLTLPRSVTEVQDYAFQSCQKLTSVLIEGEEGDVTALRKGVFRNCPVLSSVEVHGDLADCSERSVSPESSYYDYDRSSGASVFYNAGANAETFTVTFGEYATRIPSYLFATAAERSDGSYAHVTKVVVGDGVTEIGSYAFRHCYDLAELELGSAVSVIGNYAFQGNAALTALRCDGALLRIGESAFGDNTRLKTLALNEGLQTVGAAAFENNNALEQLTLPRSVTEVENHAFQSCQRLKTVVILGEEGDVTALRRGVFRNCPLLSYVEIQGELADCSEKSVNPESAYYEIDRSSGAAVFYNAGSKAERFTVAFIHSARVPAYLFASFPDKNDGRYAHVTDVEFHTPVSEVAGSAFYHCYDLARVRYCGSAEDWASVLVSDNNESLTGAAFTFGFRFPVDEYGVGALSVTDLAGNALDAIPRGKLLVTIPLTKRLSVTDATLMLATYTPEGQYRGFLYVRVKDLPSMATMYVTLPLDNSDGTIGRLSAFAIPSLSDPRPLGQGSRFPG